MRKDYEKLFTYLATPVLPEKLFDKVMGKIAGEQRLANLKKRLAFFFVLMAGSILGLIFAWHTAVAELVNSGFVAYISLIFSDTSVIVSYWQTYLYSLLESLPVELIVYCLVALLIFLESLKLIARDVKIFSLINKQLNN